MATPDIPTFEPKAFVAGETLKWTRDFADYPATDGWTLKYAIRGPGTAIDISATPNGSNYSITYQSLVGQTPGAYVWQAWVEKGSEKFYLDEGNITCLAPLSSQTTYDARSTAQKIVDAIDNHWAGKTNIDQLSYEIGSALGTRKLTRYAATELIELRKFYARIVAREKDQQRVAQGGDLIRNINTRF